MGRFIILHPAGRRSFFACTDFDDILHVVNEDFAVTDVTGVKRFLRRFDDRADRNLRDDDLHLYLRQQVCFYERAAVVFRLALLNAAAKNVLMVMPVMPSSSIAVFRASNLDSLQMISDLGELGGGAVDSVEGGDTLDGNGLGGGHTASDGHGGVGLHGGGIRQHSEAA